MDGQSWTLFDQPLLPFSQLSSGYNSTITVTEKDIVDLWRGVAVFKGLSTDADVAKFLLSFYHLKKEADDPYSASCVHCNNLLTLCCLNCLQHSQSASSPSFKQSSLLTDTSGRYSHQSPSSNQLKVSDQDQSSWQPKGAFRNTKPPHHAPSTHQTKLPHHDKSSHPVQSLKPTLSSQQIYSSCQDKLSHQANFPGQAQSSQQIQSPHEEKSSHQESPPELLLPGSLSEQSLSSQLHAPSFDLLTQSGDDNKGSDHDDSEAEAGVHLPESDEARSSSGEEANEKSKENDNNEVKNAKKNTSAAICIREWSDGKPHVTVDEFMTGRHPVPTKAISGHQCFSHHLCDQCKRVFTSESVFNHHKNSQSCEETSDCPPPQSLDTLRRIQRKHLCICAHCDFLFVSEQSYKEHVASLHDETGLHNCQSCEMLFTHASRLEDHVKPFKAKSKACRRCGVFFTNKCQKKLHLESHQKSDIKCNLCGEKFTMKREKRCHMKTQHRFRCKHCPTGFATRTEKTNHVRSAHKEMMTQVDRFLCAVCGKDFPGKWVLDKHAVVHCVGRKFPCSQCSYAGKSEFHLNYHLRNTHEEKRHQCEFCGSKFSNINSLKSHLQVHTGKRLSCGECGAKFVRQQSLDNHRRNHHTKEKPFGCKYCWKAFADKRYLTEHVKLHFGEKNYECEFCDAKFKRSDYLKKHRRLHTGERPYQCEVCLQRFIDGTVLNNHRRKCHPQTERLSSTTSATVSKYD